MKLGRRDIIAALGTLGVLLGIAVESRSHPSPKDVQSFHAIVKSAIDNYPIRIGAWEGVDQEVPAASTELLRPNAMLAREFRNYGSARVATVVVVQCQDSRDMSGHYPPNCYPNSGWMMRPHVGRGHIKLWDREVPFAQYEFTMTEYNTPRRRAITNFFILPSGRLVVDMSDVRASSGDYKVRPYGAAQVQVIMDGTVPEDERQAIVQELLEPLRDAAVEMLREPAATTEVAS